MKRIATLIGVVVVMMMGLLWGAPTAQADLQRSPSPDNAFAYIIEPHPGDTVPGTFTVKFGLSGMGIAPAGIDVNNTGHHHLLIDVQDLLDTTQPLPATEQIRHFGAGQTETELTLPPGQHTLQLVLGNYVHIPHDKPVISEPVTITVE